MYQKPKKTHLKVPLKYTNSLNISKNNNHIVVIITTSQVVTITMDRIVMETMTNQVDTEATANPVILKLVVHKTHIKIITLIKIKILIKIKDNMDKFTNVKIISIKLQIRCKTSIASQKICVRKKSLRNEAR